MDQSTRRLLGEAANQVFDLAEAMIGVGEKLNEAAGASATASSEGQLRPGCGDFEGKTSREDSRQQLKLERPEGRTEPAAGDAPGIDAPLDGPHSGGRRSLHTDRKGAAWPGSTSIAARFRVK